MAHEIESIAYRYQTEADTPWHGLGVKVGDDLNSAEFLEAAGLNWTVDEQPLFTSVDGVLIPINNKRAFVRSTDQKVFAVASKEWRPTQNKTALDFLDQFAKAGGAKFETAGSLRGGKIVWGLLALGRSFDVRPGDTVKGYLLLTVPHTVGTAITCHLTSVRTVCANTLRAGHASGAKIYSQSHLMDFDFDAARKAVLTANEDLAAAEARYKTIAGLKINLQDAVDKVLVPVFAPEYKETNEAGGVVDLPKTIDQIITSINNAPGAEIGTGWGVLNGVTHWADHVRGRNGASRLFASWLGDIGNKKTEVESKLLELV
tara:strand:+ start:1097 stop:2047 length:951 start_codon:yes stop_codon:yes gene_type:complete